MSWTAWTSSRRGSSPHTRGAQGQPPRHGQSPGIIPAYAGSTSAGALIQGTAGDHPRIRGEHADGALTQMSIGGSSPHTRGARGPGAGDAEPGGIIPAYAGSTHGSSTRAAGSPDHPRIRGEHRRTPDRRVAAGGSSPHTRGARFSRRWAWRRKADHPRIRGEHGSVDDGDVDADGSSPHTRGARAARRLSRWWCRIIPAYAGSTREHGGGRVSLPGSSPHTRGARGRRRVGWSWSGIIPAYAGSTRRL